MRGRQPGQSLSLINHRTEAIRVEQLITLGEIIGDRREVTQTLAIVVSVLQAETQFLDIVDDRALLSRQHVAEELVTHPRAVAGILRAERVKGKQWGAFGAQVGGKIVVVALFTEKAARTAGSAPSAARTQPAHRCVL